MWWDVVSGVKKWIPVDILCMLLIYRGQVSLVCHNKIIWTATHSRPTIINISSPKTTKSTNSSSRTISPHTTPLLHPPMQPPSSSPNPLPPSFPHRKLITPPKGKSSVLVYPEVATSSRDFRLVWVGWATRQRSHSVLTIASPNTKTKRIPQWISTPSAGIT